MASWGKTDAAGSAPLWAVTMLNAEPSSANRTSLYGNTTADTFITGATHGLFNYDTTETQSGAIAHTGWVLKTTGSGGRAGRVSYTTLVCLTSN
jgi:hypothetical protein